MPCRPLPHLRHRAVARRLGYVPHQAWLVAWFGSCAAALPRCEPLQFATVALVLGEWGLVPAPGFSIDFWRASKAQ
jgi:hypothetical protein